jgi:LPS sulfotransferase NodH
LLAPRSTIESYLRQLYRETAYAAIGFKLMLNQCLARPYIVELLRGLGVRVILVRRSNLLKTLVSRKAAESSGVYHVSKSLDSDSAVTAWRAEGVYINTACLLGELDAIKQENETWLRILDSRFQILHVHYEEYIADPASGNASLLDFLEIEASGLRTDLEKVNPDNLRQAITNYEDVHRALQGTRYLAMMETPSDGISH